MKQELYERLKKISERLKKEYHAEKIILYGSYVRGEGTEDSDMEPSRRTRAKSAKVHSSAVCRKIYGGEIKCLKKIVKSQLRNR